VRARDWNPISQPMTLQGIYAESLSIRGALARTLASEGITDILNCFQYED
jgi:hypothetical protein